MQTTKVIKKGENEEKWHLVDVKGARLGEVSVNIAKLLIGKGKLTYTPNLFSGDNVVVVNARHLRVPERKANSKMYYRHSGFPGGLKSLNLDEMMKKNPSIVVKNAVEGMLPKTKMGKVILGHLYVYNEETHPHTAQIK